MLYFVNALTLAWMATIWSKTGWPNIVIAGIFSSLEVVNAIAATPTIYHWLGI